MTDPNKQRVSKEALEMTLGAALAINQNDPNRALTALVVALIWLDDLFPDKGGIEGIAKLLTETSRRPGRKLRTELGDVEQYVFHVDTKRAAGEGPCPTCAAAMASTPMGTAFSCLACGAEYDVDHARQGAH